MDGAGIRWFLVNFSGFSFCGRVVTQHEVPFIAEKKNFATGLNFLDMNHTDYSTVS